MVSGDYLKYYHGVDNFDRNVMEFHSKHRCKRWYIPLFQFFMIAAMENSWTIRKDLEEKSGIPHAKVM